MKGNVGRDTISGGLVVKLRLEIAPETGLEVDQLTRLGTQMVEHGYYITSLAQGVVRLYASAGPDMDAVQRGIRAFAVDIPPPICKPVASVASVPAETIRRAHLHAQVLGDGAGLNAEARAILAALRRELDALAESAGVK